MDAKEYQKLAKRTLIDSPDFDIPADQIMVIWNAIGLSGEAGEVAELAKKGIFHQHGIDTEKFAKELGDCMWYIAALCTKLDLDMGEIMEANIEKLRERYPDGFSSEDSVKRVDVSEDRETSEPVTIQDIRTSSFEIGLTKLIGKPVKEVHGYLSAEYDAPVFKMTLVEFEDGSFLDCEGEHDFPYLARWGNEDQPNYDTDTLQRLYDEDS